VGRDLAHPKILVWPIFYGIIVQLFKSILGLAPLGLDPMHIHEPRG